MPRGKARSIRWSGRAMRDLDQIAAYIARDNPQAARKWISKLREADYFIGRKFAGARMFRNDKDELSFVISSDLAELAFEEEAETQ